MLKESEDDLICDLAETYHILDMRAHPATLIATLAAGLRPDARIMQKMSGDKVPLETLLLASIADASAAQCWQNAGAKKAKKPVSILAELLKKSDKHEELDGFSSSDEFNAWRSSVIEG